MRNVGYSLVLSLAVLSCGVAPGSDGADGFVAICPIEGRIDSLCVRVVRHACRQVDERHAEAVVFVIDTAGGRVDSAVSTAKAIADVECRTIAYLAGDGALGAGTFAAFACDEIVMVDGAWIGSYIPEKTALADTDGPGTPAGSKAAAAVGSQLGSLAQKRGHDAVVASAMADPAIELWAVPTPDGSLVLADPPEDGNESEDRVLLCDGHASLTLTCENAVKLGVAAAQCDDFDAVLARHGFESRPREWIEPPLSVTVPRWIKASPKNMVLTVVAAWLGFLVLLFAGLHVVRRVV